MNVIKQKVIKQIEGFLKKSKTDQYNDNNINYTALQRKDKKRDIVVMELKRPEKSESKRLLGTFGK